MYFFKRSSTRMEIVSIAFNNVWFPLHYVADIVKDSIQLIMCLIVVGGLENAFNNWLSFSSVVIVFTGGVIVNQCRLIISFQLVIKQIWQYQSISFICKTSIINYCFLELQHSFTRNLRIRV